MTDIPLILLIDQDEQSHLQTRSYLEQQGYKVVGKRLADDCLDDIKAMGPDLILLDVQLPDRDGNDVIRDIRATTAAPIIVISEKDDGFDKIIGLEMGADDYLGKPYEPRELLARIKSHLRLVRLVQENNAPSEIPPSKGSKIYFGNWCLDIERHELKDLEGDIIDVSAGEIELMIALASYPGRALSRDQLFDLTRERDYEGFDRAVDVQISRLRKKIGDDNADQPYIKTVRGVGYMLDAKTRVE